MWTVMAGLLVLGIALSLLLRSEPAPGPGPIPAPAPSLPPPLQGSMGAQVRVAGYGVTVLTANLNAGRALPSDPRAVRDRLVTVRVRYENLGRGAAIVSPYDWVLVDSTGSIYSAADARRASDLRERQLARGDVIEGTIEFDVTRGARGLNLYFDSETGDGAVAVPLS
jgi:hypothetical protein